MFKIPQADKKFIVDNESMTRGNIYSTFNIMFDADKGRIKLNPLLLNGGDTAGFVDFIKPQAIVIASKDSGTATDAYILTVKSAGVGFVWSTYAGLAKLAGANVPSVLVEGSCDMCLSWGLLHVSDNDGLHYVAPSSSAGAWTLNADTDFKNKSVIFHFNNTNRLYLVSGTSIVSCDSAYTKAVSGSYTQTSIPNTVTCARAASKRIWYATSDYYGQCNIYEWDGVDTNPTGIYLIDALYIQSITILNDIPVAIDDRGRLWFYDGYKFVLRDGAVYPNREDDTSTTCQVHRNGMITVNDKIYVLIGSETVGGKPKNSSERSLAGIWCYDSAIGFYHFSSPDNNASIFATYALSRGIYDKTFIATYVQTKPALNYVLSKTDISLNNYVRTGFITTQFLESKNLTDLFNAIGLKYRKMIASAAQIEVKYRTWKNIECNTLITFTNATTFTVVTNVLNSLAGNPYCTSPAIGDEVFVQNGPNAGLIAHITNRVDAGGTSTITIDRSATTTTGDNYAVFSNYTLLKTITNDGATFKNIRLAIPTTMIQVKLVLSWIGYYDEVQEIMIPEKQNETTS